MNKAIFVHYDCVLLLCKNRASTTRTETREKKRAAVSGPPIADAAAALQMWKEGTCRRM